MNQVRKPAENYGDRSRTTWSASYPTKTAQLLGKYATFAAALTFCSQHPNPQTSRKAAKIAVTETVYLVVDSSVWARTSLEEFLLLLIADVDTTGVFAVQYELTPKQPSHLVVAGPGGFNMCSCLRLLWHGLPCRHYFAVLLGFVGKGEVPGFGHTIKGTCVHTRWTQAHEMDDEAWSISQVLGSTGHDGDWDGHHVSEDDVAPTFDITEDMDVVHPQIARQEAGQRQAHASMMAKNLIRTMSVIS